MYIFFQNFNHPFLVLFSYLSNFQENTPDTPLITNSTSYNHRNFTHNDRYRVSVHLGSFGRCHTPRAVGTSWGVSQTHSSNKFKCLQHTQCAGVGACFPHQLSYSLLYRPTIPSKVIPVGLYIYNPLGVVWIFFFVTYKLKPCCWFSCKVDYSVHHPFSGLEDKNNMLSL